MSTQLKNLSNWVAEVAAHTQPDQIYWCTGTKDEYKNLITEMLASGDLKELNHANYPDCYLHLSDPQDVARVEHLTYVCAEREVDAGPNNNWMAPVDAPVSARSNDSA